MLRDPKRKLAVPTREQALPGRPERMPVPAAHFVNGRPLTPPFPAGLERAMFGLGCFWGAEKRFWHSDDFDHALETLGANDANPFRTLAIAGKEAAQHHRASQPQLHDVMDISDWLTRSLKSSIDDAVAHMQSGLAVLASVGSTAPFVGLFGTVWGIYHALISISIAGQASLDKVACPIGEALIMTALGLAVAVPAVLGFNGLLRGNRSLMERANYFAHDVQAALVSGSRVPGK